MRCRGGAGALNTGSPDARRQHLGHAVEERGATPRLLLRRLLCCGLRKAPLQLTVDSMRFALARSSRGTSPGPSGWTSEAWRDLCEDERTLDSITLYINGSFCKGQLPVPLMQMWGACNTIALTKPKGGYRPISMGETLRRARQPSPR